MSEKQEQPEQPTDEHPARWRMAELDDPGLDIDGVAVQRFDDSVTTKWTPTAPLVEDHDLDDDMVTRLLYAHEERGSSSVEVLKHALSIAQKRPTRRTLERMRSVANEIGRRPDGGTALAAVLTHEVLDDLVERNHAR